MFLTQLYVTVATVYGIGRDRLIDRVEAHRDDTGAVTLEYVLIAAGLFVVATAVVIAITAVIKASLAKIHA